MIDFHSLEQKLDANLDWHGARIKFLARFLVALITTRTVNLAAIAQVFAGTAQPDSNYECCRRFLKDFELPYAQIAHLIVQWLGVTDGWTLALDRTNWKFGKVELNLLVLAIVHHARGLSGAVVSARQSGELEYGRAHSDPHLVSDLV